MVVTRFAPSPTGYLHIGGARTALFNWLLARNTGGKFILRIEDTDIKRNTPTATKQLIDDLKWLGIDWNEGPEVGGPNGPYFQSQRKDIYDKYVKQLLDEKKAYYCFETSEKLQEARSTAAKRKQGFAYQRPESFPTHDDAQKARAEGRHVAVRFAVPQDRPIVVEDVVRGEVTFAADEINDFVILKSDGFPTYHFAVVVDDELMDVTHVLRGQEHLMNTPGHQVLQDALGFRRPIYAHMSVTVSESGGKLSKRERPQALRQAIKAACDIDLEKLAAAARLSAEKLDSFIKAKTIPDMPVIEALAAYLGIHLPEINVIDFFRSGYLPETMVNFLGLLGFSAPDDREFMTLQEQIECFDLKRLAKSNSFFDRKKLLAFNTEHIRSLEPAKLLCHFKAYLSAASSPLAKADEKLLTKILNAAQGARTLAEIDAKSKFVVIPDQAVEYDQKAVEKVLLKADGLNMLKVLAERLTALDEFTNEEIEKLLRSLAEEKQVGLGKVAQPLRVALCGNTISLPIFDSVQMLGKEQTLARIERAVKKFKSQN